MFALKVQLQCLLESRVGKWRREGGKDILAISYMRNIQRNQLTARDMGGNRDLWILSHVITKLFLSRPPL